MRLTILGAGPAYTDRRGAAGASYLLRADGHSLVLDLGQGAFPNLASTIEPSTLTGIVITHLHPDHFIDLVPLRHYLRYEFHPPRRVDVLAPSGLGDRLDALHAEPGFAAQALDVGALCEGGRQIGPFTVEARCIRHTDESYALRVSLAGDGPGLVYSGDCGDADDLVPLIRPGDWFLCEASFGAGTVPPGAEHLTAREAARAANAGEAGRLLLTHIQIGCSRTAALDQARETFAGASMVTEGDEFEI